MGVNLLDAAAHAKGSKLAPGIAKIITEVSPVYDRISHMQFDGNAYTYEFESAIPDAEWRAVGGVYTRGTGKSIKVTESVAILGREVYVDNFLVRVASNRKDLKARKFAEVARGVGMRWERTFFEGDTHVDPLSFNGLRTRLSGNQVITAGANGTALTLDMMDETLDTVAVGAQKHLYMNRFLRRKLTALAAAATGSRRVEYKDLDSFGKQMVTYNDAQIHVVERVDDGSTILDFDETQGSSSVTASIYVVTFGDEEYVFGMLGAGGSLDVKDFGEIEASPGHLGRIELYPGMAIKHPRCAARLKGLTEA